MTRQHGKPGSGKGKALGDARGGLRLVVEGARHITGVVEALHGQIQRLAPPLRLRLVRADDAKPAQSFDTDGLPRTRGLTGMVYRSIQGGTRLIGDGLDGLLAPFDEALNSAPPTSTPRRDALVAALNGVLGDHLLRSGNPLAIPLQLRQGGLPLVPTLLGVDAPRRVILLVHGLCMSDLGWRRNSHDHGQLLARAMDASPVYVFYNSGLHVSINGRALADALEQMLLDWPVPLDDLTIVGHSMGGLVARSACHLAMQAGYQWPARLRKMVFMGTPHHGAPLERAGNWLHRVMDLSPYVAPFNRLSRLRSEGITDLRHGNLLDADWLGVSRFDHRDLRQAVPLPTGVVCYAIASTAGGAGASGSMRGDGLVPIDSALGRHRDPAFDLGLPDDRCWLGHGTHHLDLLSDPAVYRRLLGWLQPTCSRR